MSSSNCCFLNCIQISSEAGQVVWYSHLLKTFSTVYCDPHSKSYLFCFEKKILNQKNYLSIPYSYPILSSCYCPNGYPVSALTFPAIIYFLILKRIRPCHPSAQKPGVVSYLSMNKSWSPYKGLSDLGPGCPVILFSFTSFQLHWLPRQHRNISTSETFCFLC